MATILLTLFAMGCGDRCELLCRDVSARLDECRNDSLSWADLGARNKPDFIDQCRFDWDRTSGDLTSSARAEALDICRTGREDLEKLDCDEIRLLYAP